MAKRQAGNQLNHDNWDEEEDQESAGVFKKASDNEISGRVIKKAARRRVNPMAAGGAAPGGEEKKNAFASFGGFSATSTPVAGSGSDSFGFLKKGTDSTAPSGGFSFGKSASANTSTFSFGGAAATADPAKSAGFSFGSSGTAATKTSTFSFGSSQESAAKPASTGFAFGSSPVTSTATTAAASKGFAFGSPAASDASKSGGFVFGSSASKPSAVAQPTPAFAFGSSKEEKKEEAIVKPVFGSPASSNGDSAASKGGDLATMFKPKAGTWSCDVCMINNPSDKTKCAACEQPKPGSKPETNGSMSTSVFGVGTAGGAFKFGSDSGGGGGSLATAGGGFQFGSSKESTTSNTSSPISGIKFGAGTTNSTSVSGKTESMSSGFSFGDKKTDGDKGDSSAFKIGGGVGAGESKSTGGFSFGGSSTPKVSVGDNKTSTQQFGAFTKDSSSIFSSSVGSDNAAAKPAAGGFTFGSGKSDNSNSSDSSSSKGNLAGFAFGANTTPATKITAFGTEKKEAVTAETDNRLEYSEEFLAHLKALNKQVTQWIQKHINDNSYVILSPVFKDYEKHLKDITEKYPMKKNSSIGLSSSPLSTGPPAATKLSTPSTGFLSSSSAPKFPHSTSSSPANTAVKPFSFGGSNPSDSTKTEAVKPFSFGASADSKTESVKPFSFGSSEKTPAPAASTPSSGGFSFGLAGSQPPASGGFSFGQGMFAHAPGAGSTNAPSAGAAANDEEYEPPKEEVKVVEESDALYSKKCKLFYKKDGNYVEKGVGMLHLKSADNNKTQLLIRADTNLGNILLNIILNKDIPTTRVGKNNVMLVCVPNPPINPKDAGNEPVGMLIRVKTGDDADELKTKLDDLKSK